MTPEIDACAECLRRAWLIGDLSPFIQVACDDRPGSRTPELLALPDEKLASAVAPRRADELLSHATARDEGELRERIEASDSWAVCRHGEGYPAGLREVDDAPRLLLGRGVRQRLPELVPDGCVTLVGARRATGYGLEVASSLGHDLAVSGMQVVSGLAIGIDAAAHRGALEGGGTVAVLGCGPDVCYPATHRRLYLTIVDRGVVLSELPPGTGARRWTFPARNRIMAALAGMTVVVEAASRSGSLITAGMAADAGREVGAVPGPVTGRMAGGANDLLASGAAVIRDANDVLDRMIGVGGRERRLFGPDPGPAGHEVLDAVEAGCRSVDGIAAVTGSTAAQVAATVTRLEVQGYLAGNLTGGWNRTRLPAPDYAPAGDGPDR